MRFLRGGPLWPCAEIAVQMREQSMRRGMLLMRAETEPPGSGSARRASLKLFGERGLDLIHA